MVLGIVWTPRLNILTCVLKKFTQAVDFVANLSSSFFLVLEIRVFTFAWYCPPQYAGMLSWVKTLDNNSPCGYFCLFLPAGLQFGQAMKIAHAQGSAFLSAACFPKCGCPADSFGCTKTFTPCCRGLHSTIALDASSHLLFAVCELLHFNSDKLARFVRHTPSLNQDIRNTRPSPHQTSITLSTAGIFDFWRFQSKLRCFFSCKIANWLIYTLLILYFLANFLAISNFAQNQIVNPLIIAFLTPRCIFDPPSGGHFVPPGGAAGAACRAIAAAVAWGDPTHIVQ